MKLNKVNDFLSNIQPIEENVVLAGPDTVKNIVLSEISDIQRISTVSKALFDVIAKDAKRLPLKDQQSLWRDMEAVIARKEDFIFKIAQETNKSEFLNKVFNLKGETVIAEDGTVYTSSVPEETTKEINAMLIDILNERAHERD